MIVDPRNYTKSIEPIYKAVYDTFIKVRIDFAYKRKKQQPDLILYREIDKFNPDKACVRRYDLFGKKSECRHFYSNGEIYAIFINDVNPYVCRPINDYIWCGKSDIIVSPIVNIQANCTFVWFTIQLIDFHKNSITTKLLSEINEELKLSNFKKLRLFYELDEDLLNENFTYDKYIECIPVILMKNI